MYHNFILSFVLHTFEIIPLVKKKYFSALFFFLVIERYYPPLYENLHFYLYYPMPEFHNCHIFYTRNFVLVTFTLQIIDMSSPKNQFPYNLSPVRNTNHYYQIYSFPIFYHGKKKRYFYSPEIFRKEKL